MTREKRNEPPGLPDDLPPCLIHVDKEGRLWHLGAEMIHEGINQLLMAHVDLDDLGRYIISFRGQHCWVEVEDTFFVISRVEGIAGDGGLSRLTITLNDGTQEDLDPATLTQSQENVLYAQVKGGRFPARFLRKSYYQLTEFIVEKDDRFYLTLDHQDFLIG